MSFSHKLRRIALIVFLTIGGVMISYPVVTVAAQDVSESMNDMPDHEEMLCVAIECQARHGDCSQHCFIQSDDVSVVAAIPLTAHHLSVHGASDRKIILFDQYDSDIVVPFSTRAPPRHQFLRSVMKRE